MSDGMRDGSPAAPARAPQPEGSRSLWAVKFRQVLASDQILAWADQGLVSGLSFVVIGVLAWGADLAELGVYALCASIVALGLATQDALVTRPYVLRQSRLPAREEEHSSDALLLSLTLSVAGALVIGAAGALAVISEALQARWTAVIGVLAIALPPIMAREFVRRRAFAGLKFRQAFLLDVAVVGLNLVLLGLLAWLGRLNAASALGIQALSCGVCAGVCLALQLNGNAVHLSRFRAAWNASWTTGRWLFSTQVALQVQGYASHWLSLVLLGAASTGIYTACATLVSVVNPVLYGCLNLIVPRSARAFARQGGVGVRRQAGKDAALLGALTGGFCLLLVVAGESLIGRLLPGAAGNGALLAVLALTCFAGSLGVPAAVALTSADRASLVTLASVFGAVCNLGLAFWLIPSFGLVGAAYAALITESAGSVARWTALFTLVPDNERGGAATIAEATPL